VPDQIVGVTSSIDDLLIKATVAFADFDSRTLYVTFYIH